MNQRQCIYVHLVIYKEENDIEIEEIEGCLPEYGYRYDRDPDS